MVVTYQIENHAILNARAGDDISITELRGGEMVLYCYVDPFIIIIDPEPLQLGAGGGTLSKPAARLLLGQHNSVPIRHLGSGTGGPVDR